MDRNRNFKVGDNVAVDVEDKDKPRYGQIDLIDVDNPLYTENQRRIQICGVLPSNRPQP